MVLAIVVVTVGVFFYQLVRDSKNLEESVRQQEYRAGVLMEEVGQAKQDNTLIFQRMLETQKVLDKFEVIPETGLQDPNSAGNLNLASGEKVPRAVAVQPSWLPINHTRNYLVIGQNSNLADSIMLVAVEEATKAITLISIPRDMYVNGRKINEYLSLYGIEIFKEKIALVTAMGIDGYAIINFDSFEKIIDSLGGIDLNVPSAIYDAQYPNGRGAYEVYSLSAGSHHLTGTEALKYARSRHSTSDFDRAGRQQQILKSVQERLLNFDFINNLGKIKEIYEGVTNSLETDMSFLELVDSLSKYRDYSTKSGNVISTSNFLYSTYNIAGQYILLPRGGDFSKIQEYIRGLL